MEIYHIHNVVRRVGTRLKRQQAAGRHRLQQNLGGGSIIIRRNRYAEISAARLPMFLEELKQKVAAGTLELRTRSGQVVDPSTMKSAKAAPSKPQLAKHEDAGVAGDKPPGAPATEVSTSLVDTSATDMPSGHAGSDSGDETAVEVAPGGDPVVARKSQKSRSSSKSSSKASGKKG